MKKTKILVPALAVLALGMAASVTGTVAWFAANNVVNANGMQIQSSTPSSLAIGEEIVAGHGIGDSTVINYAAATNILNPCSHFKGGEETAEGSLWTVVNGNDIDPASGLAMPFVAGNGLGADALNNNTHAEGSDGYRDIEYTDATSSGHNYVDYVCYLASVGQAIQIGQNGYLQVKLNWGDPNQTTYATTVDFWVNAGASTTEDGIGTYMGTLNRAGVLASAGQAGAPLASYTPTTTAGEDVTYVTLMSPTQTIPVNTGNAAVKVTMRVYLDGALLQNNAKTYVTTNDVSTDGISIAAVFTLERGQQNNG